MDKDCVILARNSRLATELVTAQPGDERDVPTPGGDRYLNVREIRLFDGPVSLRSPNQRPNFRSMAIRSEGQKRPRIVEDLRATIQRSTYAVQDGASSKPQAPVEPYDLADPAWLTNWSGVRLADTEEQSLGHEFITRTTEDQERALNNPRGLTFVEGVAGAGKTSVALGRLKFFANFSSGVELEYYGLKNASLNDFSPEGMMGFVLSHSLKRYLKETADSLELHHLPIRDFEDFRIELADRFGIANRFRKRKAKGASYRSQANWLRALDVAMARVAGVRLRENLEQIKSPPAGVVDGIFRLATELLHAECRPETEPFHLDGLASRVASLTFEAEFRDQEARANDEFRVREKKDDEQRRREELALEREMRRIQQLAEKKHVSPTARLLLSRLTSHDLFSSALTLET